MGSLDEPINYHSVMGISGAAFRFVLARDIWYPGNYGIQNFTEKPDEPIHRALAAAGRRADVHECRSSDDDRKRIMSSIDKGIPVLAFGAVGPSDCVLVTGYDDDGDVLLGWSTYQDIPDDHDIPHDPLGYFRKPDWHANTRGYVILGDKHQPIEPRRIYRDSLELAHRVITTPALGDRTCGLKALGTWSEAMGDDANIPVDDETMGWRYLGYGVNTMMLTDQLSAVPFLKEAASALPEISDLLNPAVQAYELNTETIQQAKALIADDFSPRAIGRFRDSTVRKEYAELMMEICRNTEKAAHVMKIVVSHIDTSG